MTKKQLIEKIVIKWLGKDCPEHISTPQKDELLILTKAQLKELYGTEFSEEKTKRYDKAKIDKKIIIRLFQRRRLVYDIKKAERENLYDVMEHYTSMIDLEE